MLTEALCISGVNTTSMGTHPSAHVIGASTPALSLLQNSFKKTVGFAALVNINNIQNLEI